MPSSRQRRRFTQRAPARLAHAQRVLEPDDAGAGRLVGPTPRHTIWVNKVPEPKQAKNRLHIDLVSPDPDAVNELVRLGATVIGKHQIPGQRWTVIHDPEGNGFCIAAKSFTGID